MRDIGVDRKIPTGESFSHEREYTRPEEIKILQKYLKAGIQALADSTELEENTSDENKLIVSSISSLNDSRIDLPGELQTQLDNSVTDLLDSRENKLDSRVENISSEGIKELDSNRENINDTSKGEGDLIDNPNVIRLDVPQGDTGLDKSVIEISDKEDVKLSEGSEILRDDTKVELDKSVSEITENNIDRLSNQVEEISEKPLTTLDKILEKLQGKNISDLDNRITEISDKKDIKLDSNSLKIKIAGLKELSEESEKIDPGKTPDLDKTITELPDSTEVELTDDSEKISSDIKIDLNSSITELSDKKDIDLSEKSEELKDDRKINLSDESETITENKISKLSELRENIKNLEEVNLDDKKEIITDEKQKELNDSIIQISDSKEVKLKEKSEKIKTDIKTELNLSSEKLENETKLDKLSEDFQSITNENEPELNNTITELSNSDISNLNNSVENISPQDISDLNSSREGLENNIKTESLNNSREEFKNTIEPELNDSRESLDDPSVETDGNGHITSSTTELNNSREEFKNEKEVELDNSREDFSGIDVDLNDSREEFKNEKEVELKEFREDLDDPNVEITGYDEKTGDPIYGNTNSKISLKVQSKQIDKKNKIDIKKSENSDKHSNLQASRLVEAEVKRNTPNEKLDDPNYTKASGYKVKLRKDSILPNGFGREDDGQVISLQRSDSISGKAGTNEPEKVRDELDREKLENTGSRRQSSLDPGTGVSQNQISLKVQSKQIDKKNKIDTKKSENSDKHSNLKASRLVEAEVKKNTPNEKLDDPNYTKASGYKIKLDKDSVLPNGFIKEDDKIISLQRSDSISGKAGTNEPEKVRDELDRDELSGTNSKRTSNLDPGTGVSQNQISLKIQSKQIDKKNKIDAKKSENSKQHSNLQASRLVEAEVKRNTPNEKLDDPNYTKASGYKIKLDKEKSEIDKAGASHPVSSTGPSQTQIDAVKLYLGLTTSEGTSYEKAASILDKCGDWGKKVIAQLTNTLVQEKGKKPYELLDPAKVQTFYDSVKNTYSMDDPDADEVFGLKDKIEEIINDDTFYLDRGKGKNVGMLKYKSPDSANSALELINNPSAGIRALVELAVNALNAKGKTKQLLLDEAVGLAVLARDEAQKLAGADPGRLPGRAGVLEGMLQTYASGKGLVNTALSGIGDYFFDSPVKKDPLNRPYAYVKGQKVEGVNKLDGDTTWESLEKPKELQKGIFVEKSLDGLFLTRFKDKNSGNGFDTTLSELVISGSNSSESELYKSNYEKFISGLKQSPYITTSSNLVDWRQEDRDMLTLDSNHVWEIRLFPYTGPENGFLSYLPSFNQLNNDNYKNFGYATRWNGWIPFSGFEFQQAKMTGKSTNLFDGEINYPISIEFTNELRLSLSDDSFKSWKRYFMACSEAAIYHCTKSFTDTDYFYDRNYYIKSETQDLSSYIERGVLCPKNYKNITFRCLIYVMNPQFYTVKKLDLLVVLRDFLIDWQGENDASATDLSLTFSVVGENPAAETPVIPSYTIPEKEEPEQKDWGGTATSKLSQIIGVL